MMAKFIVILLTGIVSGILGGLPIPTPNLKFKLLSADVTGTPNDYLRTGEVIISPDGYSCSVHTDITKEYPSNIMLNVAVKYAKMEIPPMVLEACTAFHEPVFVKEVISKGEPKDIFPHACPIQPGDYTVVNYSVPHHNIPPGTPPGPVEVLVELFVPGNDPIMHLHVKGILEAGF